MELSYRFRIYPRPLQEDEIERIFGTCRYAYNHYLHFWKQHKDEEGFNFSSFWCLNDFTKFRVGKIFLYDTDVAATRIAISSLEGVIKKYNRGKSGVPKYKSKKNLRQSYTTHGIIRVGEDYVKLPHVGNVKAIISREVNGKIKEATVTRDRNGCYYVSLVCSVKQSDKFEKTGKSIGIDMGVANLATLSNGETIENKKFYSKSKKKVKKLRKRVSRKPRGSKNRRKAEIKLYNAIERYKNQRFDYMHNQTTKIVKNYDLICLESLDIKSMMSGFMFSRIMDAAMGIFVRQIEYKAKYYGKDVVFVPRRFPSSKICSDCGYKMNKMPLEVREWVCPNCGCYHNRDENAAINILNMGTKIYEEAMGTSLVVCGDSVGPLGMATVVEAESESDTKVPHNQ